MKKVSFNTVNSDKELRNFGVYKITNTITGKSYIGSTTYSFRTRWAAHLLDLKNDNHDNLPLQNAWNKYGENSFLFSIIEPTSAENVLSLEQREINARTPKELYNVCLIAGNTKGVRQSLKSIDDRSHNWVFVSPDNIIYRERNMHSFCRKHNLPQSHLINIANRKTNHHKGWLAYHEEDFGEDLLVKDRQKLAIYRYVLTSPTGETFIPYSLREFCEKNKLNHSTFLRSLRVAKKIALHKGWGISVNPNVGIKSK